MSDPRPCLPRILPTILPFWQDTDDGVANNRRDAFPPGGKLKLDLRFEGEAADGKAYDTLRCKLPVTIAVGYKLNSARADQFRKWASGRVNP